MKSPEVLVEVTIAGVGKAKREGVSYKNRPTKKTIFEKQIPFRTDDRGV